MTEKPYTDEERAWIEKNRGTIRKQIMLAGLAPKPAPSEGDVGRLADGLIRSMKNTAGNIEQEIAQARRKMDRDRRRMATETDPEDLADYTEDAMVRMPSRITVLEAHQAGVVAKIAKLESDPESCFLPIGTIVSFMGTPPYADSGAYFDRRNDFPADGSVGVVTTLNQKGEYALGVSMRNAFHDRAGRAYLGGADRDPDQITTYFVDREMVEVIGYALKPNGEEFHGTGFEPTHHVKDEWVKKHGGRGVEMVLEADGYFWRFHDFGGTQGIEALRASVSLDDMSWIGEPIEPKSEPEVENSPGFR